jgi:hypothetical protein
MKWPTAPNAADATANTLSTKAAEAYSIFWICSLSSGLDPNKINGLSKKTVQKCLFAHQTAHHLPMAFTKS